MLFPTLPRRRPTAAVLTAVLVVATAGCPTEVAYEPDDTAADEAPAFEPVDAPAEPEASDPASEEPPAEPVDRYADTAPAQPTTPGEAPADEAASGEAKPSAPWWSSDATPPPAEAGELFSQVEDPPAAEPRDEDEPRDDDGGDFGDLLGDAYTGLIDEPSETPPADAAATGPGDLDPVAPAEATPAPPTEEDVSSVAKPPTTTEPSDSDLLADLWGDADGPEPEPEPEPRAETLPEPVADAAPPTPTLPFDLAPEPEPEPLPEPLPEPEPSEPEPRVASVPKREPLGGSAVEPLPAVPVLAYNTRHLAWLLGGKLSLARLADLDGATADEVDAWRDETVRLAKELKVEPPSAVGGGGGSDAERVARLMDHAARLGEAVARQHGADHAALFEIALKSNALLVVAGERPGLAAPVADAIRGAADRAMLPSFLWEDAVQSLGREPSADEVQGAVVRLHQRVESFLR